MDQALETKNLTVMITDIQGFTDATSRQSRSQTMVLIERHREVVLPVMERFSGKLIKTMGDAFLVTFESPTNAVLAGMGIQEALQQYNSSRPSEEHIEIRVAINSGEVTLHNGDIYGEAVNITSRLEGIAEVGEVYFTESVFLSMNKTEVPSSEIGFRQFKGIPQKIKVYKVLRETPVGAMPETEPSPHKAPKETAVPGGVPEGIALTAAVAADPRAGFWPRLFAVLIDAIIIGILTSALFSGREAGVGIRVSKDGKARKGARVSITDGEGRRVTISRKGDRRGSEVGVQVKAGAAEVSVTADADKAGGFLEELANDLEVTEEEPAPRSRSSKGFSPGFVFCWLAYNALFLSFMSTTAGKKIMRLRVVDAETGQNLNWKKSLLRSLFTIVSGTPAFLGFGWALWDKQGRTWHDLVIGTRVVRAAP